MYLVPGKPYRMGRLSTVDLHALTSLDWLVLHIEKFIYLSYKTSYPNQEVNCTERLPLQQVFPTLSREF
jgi:hypothetical protein